MVSLRYFRKRFALPFLLLLGFVVSMKFLWERRVLLFGYLHRFSSPSPKPFEQLRLVVAFPKLPLFDRPALITYPPDGTDRLFIVEQPGRVFWIDNVPWSAKTHLVLDIRDRVAEDFVFGIFGLAFHPEARSNRRVFLHYTSAKHKGPVIAEFRLDEKLETIAAGSERILLEFPAPFEHHDGGNLEFGPDGLLYISIGHGGPPGDLRNDPQLLDNLLGKILRIDVDRRDPGLEYSIPPDNPFVDEAGAREEIWALGFRNIWRFSFDRDTKELWAADVGSYHWEEVDIVVKGGNYGWNYYEGPQLSKLANASPTGTQFMAPVLVHAWGDVSTIIGGYVYRGQKLPFLRGAYIYGDFISGKVLAAFQRDGVWEKRVFARTHSLEQWDQTKLRPPQESRHITTFGEDKDGELYFATYDGRIFKFQ